ncbi:MAG: hypothetical protein RLZZ127_2465 [Planctomycetota bacterium]
MRALACPARSRTVAAMRALLLCLCLLAGAPAQDAAPAAGLAVGPSASVAAWVETRIIAVLRAECWRCHSEAQRKRQGGFTADSLAGFLAGGHDEPLVLAPYEPDHSALMRSLRWEGDSDLNMPPNRPLPPEVVADFERWIRMGAPWPTGIAATVAAVPAALPPWLGMAHPAMVHLPIGILLAALVLELVAIRWQTLRPAVTILVVLAVLGGIAAAASGIALEDHARGLPKEVERHALAGWATLLLSVLAAVFSRRTQAPGRSRGMAFVLILAAAVAASFTGHLGGMMVHPWSWPW